MATTTNPDDPLAHLGARTRTLADKAQRLSDVFMQVTLVFVFTDITFLIAFMLAEAHILPANLSEVVSNYWIWPSGATVAALALSCICGLLKITDELTR